ncbi:MULTISPECIES: cytochrome c [Vibrio]|uniref:Cytochrome C n=1 Tax=Vibrio splendidus TaxID=29497 RepID=A0A2N7JSR9_VIBSP|nr:cytochrome c [Vibrio splendidus]PMM60477.1 cytochrome C [Vibrio splendidus]
MKKLTIALLIALPVMAIAATEAVNNRQQAFSSIEKLNKQVSSELGNRNTDWMKIEELSESLVEHGIVLSNSFSVSDSGGKATEAVWSKPEKFNQLMLQMNQGFTELQQASIEQDLSKAGRGLDAANNTCRACHRTYRSRW